MGSWRRICINFRRWWFDREFRGGLLWWFGLSICVYLISTIVSASTLDSSRLSKEDRAKGAIIFNQTHSDSIKYTDNLNLKLNNINPIDNRNELNRNAVYWYIMLGVLIGIIIWLLISYVLRKMMPNREISEGNFSILLNIQTKKEIFSVSLVIVGFLLLITITSIVIWNNPVERATWWEKFIENPGGPFALITGAGTLVGTYFAIKAILDMKHTITSYPQLLDRLTNLINTAPNSNDGIKILSYFILPGNWQVRSEPIKTKFKNAIRDEEKLFKIACLNPEDHLSMLIDIAKKGTRLIPDIDPIRVLKFQNECEELLINYNSDNRKTKYQSEPIRLKWCDLPRYYFFVSDDRAIIVMPVGLPQINELIDSEKVKEIVEIMGTHKKKKDRTEDPKLVNMILEQLKRLNNIPDIKFHAEVDTLGFETTDRHIIEKLQIQFDQIVKSAQGNS